MPWVIFDMAYRQFVVVVRNVRTSGLMKVCQLGYIPVNLEIDFPITPRKANVQASSRVNFRFDRAVKGFFTPEAHSYGHYRAPLNQCVRFT